MSTQPLERRRIRPVGRRGELRRIATLLGVLAGVFAISFGIGHIRRAGETVVERTPPRLSAVPTPVEASLASAPAIKLAVAKPPPPKPSTAAKSSSSAAASTPASSSPATTTPVISPAPAAQPVAPPSKPVTPVTPTPSPAPRSSGPSGSSGSGSSGSGSGTSFESSG